MKFRALSVVGCGAQKATVRFHDLTADRQPHAAVLRLRGDEGIEGLVRSSGRRSYSGVADRDQHLTALASSRHIDDVSRDEPFLVNVRDKPFAVMPYTLHMNDIVDYETRYFSAAIYADDLKVEFDALYAEAGTRRRMMSASAHDRIAGRPSRAKVLDHFVVYAQSHPGVVFMRNDEIARFALASPLTMREVPSYEACRKVATNGSQPQRNRRSYGPETQRKTAIATGGTAGICLIIKALTAEGVTAIVPAHSREKLDKAVNGISKVQTIVAGRLRPRLSNFW
jgi:hypothetical protein